MGTSAMEAVVVSLEELKPQLLPPPALAQEQQMRCLPQNQLGAKGISCRILWRKRAQLHSPGIHWFTSHFFPLPFLLL